MDCVEIEEGMIFAELLRSLIVLYFQRIKQNMITLKFKSNPPTPLPPRLIGVFHKPPPSEFDYSLCDGLLVLQY